MAMLTSLSPSPLKGESVVRYLAVRKRSRGDETAEVTVLVAPDNYLGDRAKTKSNPRFAQDFKSRSD
jgi:hypothetical protein